MVPVRGNVDTRLRSLAEGKLDAVVLAAAGLERLGLAERIAEILDLERMIPAVGQGALAVQARAVDAGQAWARILDDPATRQAVVAERSFLAAMGGGCRAPFAAHARLVNGRLAVAGAALSPDGGSVVRDEVVGAPDEGGTLGVELAERLLARGAERLAAGDAA